jgi:hypothetical protein
MIEILQYMIEILQYMIEILHTCDELSDIAMFELLACKDYNMLLYNKPQKKCCRESKQVVEHVSYTLLDCTKILSNVSERVRVGVERRLTTQSILNVRSLIVLLSNRLHIKRLILNL